MKTSAVVLLAMLVANVALIEPQGSIVDDASAQNITGGCTVTHFTEGKKQDGSEQCSACVNRYRKCDSSGTDSACIDLEEGDDETECGTCSESCGGTEKYYANSTSENPCSGTFTTSSCVSSYDVAEEQ